MWGKTIAAGGRLGTSRGRQDDGRSSVHPLIGGSNRVCVGQPPSSCRPHGPAVGRGHGPSACGGRFGWGWGDPIDTDSRSWAGPGSSRGGRKGARGWARRRLALDTEDPPSSSSSSRLLAKDRQLTLGWARHGPGASNRFRTLARTFGCAQSIDQGVEIDTRATTD